MAVTRRRLTAYINELSLSNAALSYSTKSFNNELWYYTGMKSKDNNDSIRVAVVSALAAISVGLLAVLHDSEKLFGFFVVESGFVWQIYNFIIILLFFEIILCIVFLSSTGFVYSFKDGKHFVAKWIQKTAYSWLVAIFPLSFISIVYIFATKVFSFDVWTIMDILIVLVTVVLIILIVILIIVIIIRQIKSPKTINKH